MAKSTEKADRSSRSSDKSTEKESGKGESATAVATPSIPQMVKPAPKAAGAAAPTAKVDPARESALSRAVQQIEKQFGKGSVMKMNENPEPIEGIGLKEIVDHYERIVRALPVKPIIMGHSFGGLIAQMLADRGLGVAVVGVAPAQPAGITTLPLSTLWTGAPILSNPFRKNGATPLSKGHFHFTFGNDLPSAASDELWERYAVPSYNRVFFEGVAAAFNEKGGVSHVDYGRTDRAPLLVMAGDRDHVVPPAIAKAIVTKYRSSGSPAVVEYREYPGRTHRLVSQTGWEQPADDALAWAMSHARREA